MIPDLTTDEEVKWLSENFSFEQHTIITDGYGFDSDYQKKIKKAGFRLFCVDDLATEQMFADVVINHSMQISANDYKAQPYTRFALGTKYALLRPMFLQAAAESREVKKITSVFVCFGGADAPGNTYKSIIALLEFSQIENIVVVLGAACRDERIDDLAKKDSRVQIYRNISGDSLVAQMKDCQLAVCPTSNILYEVFAVKMPALAGYYVENQKKIYEGCKKLDLIYDAGNFADLQSEDITAMINKILGDNNLQRFVDRQALLFDKEIRARFLKLLEEVTFRPAADTDMQQIFDWANDDVARKNSYQQGKISLEQHQLWFEKKLQDPDSYIYIFSVDGMPAGMVRFDVVNSSAVVGILLDKNFRGMGLSARFLMLAGTAFLEKREADILAYIKEENEASLKAFKKAGYQEIGKDVVHGAQSRILKYTHKNV